MTRRDYIRKKAPLIAAGMISADARLWPRGELGSYAIEVAGAIWDETADEEQEPSSDGQPRGCSTCKYGNGWFGAHPCLTCRAWDNADGHGDAWEPREEG
jgi:hypothetical protein